MFRQLFQRLPMMSLSSSLLKTPVQSLCHPVQAFSLLTRLPSLSMTAPNKVLLPACSALGVQPNAGYKVKVRLRKRCQHCFYVRRRGRWFVECKEKGRHKQMQKMGKRHLWLE